MPPVGRRKYQGPRRPGERSAKVTKRNKTGIRHYNQSLNTAKNTSRLLKIRTLLPKEINLSLQYRQQLIFANHGTAPSPGVNTPTLIKINLLDPAAHVDAANAGIVTVIAYGGATTSPIFTTQNPDPNLSAILTEYSDKYEKIYVTGSQCKVRVQPVANQLLGQYFSNVDAQGAQNDGYPFDENHPPYMKVNAPQLDGEVYVWGVKQRSEGNLYANNNGLTMHQVRTELPGVQMKKVTAFANGTSTKAVQLTSKYTPKFLGIKDVKDNISMVEINADGTARTNQDARNSYFYVGIMNRTGSTQAKKVALQVVDIVVNYNVKYLNRSNDPVEGDDPLPQAGGHEQDFT